MIDPVTSWFEISAIKLKRANTIANAVETIWMTRYPYTTQVVLDRGKKFMTEFSEMILKDYGVKKKPIAVRNPQANCIIERMRQIIGNMIRSFEVHSTNIDEKYPWMGILSVVRFATRATVHTTMQATPIQLVFDRGAILNVKYEADWSYIKERREGLIKKNNKQENKKTRREKYTIIKLGIRSYSKEIEQPNMGQMHTVDHIL
eukprot:2758683-Ditylum_brightwellii.AAC.1